jgi:hypothetical protein
MHKSLNHGTCGQAKNSSFANFGLRVGSWGLQMCCFMGGVSIVFVGGRKNKINSLAWHQPIHGAPIQSIRFCYFFYRINVSWFGHTLAAN